MPQTTVLFDQNPQRVESDFTHLPEQIMIGAVSRLKMLALRMFGPFPQGEWDIPIEELHQQSAMRIRQAVENADVHSPLHLFMTSASQIRAELLNIARQISVPLNAPATGGVTVENSAKPEMSTEKSGCDDSASKPESLEVWTELHSSIDRLPERERQAFDLIWYHDLTQREAAKLMEISEFQLRRYWISARLKLRDVLCSFQLSELD